MAPGANGPGAFARHGLRAEYGSRTLGADISDAEMALIAPIATLAMPVNAEGALCKELLDTFRKDVVKELGAPSFSLWAERSPTCRSL